MANDEIAELVARAAAPESRRAGDQDRRSRQQALAALIPALTRSAKASGIRAVAAGRWLTDLIIELAPRIAVRDAQTLRRQHPGQSDTEIAERLIRQATRATAGLGAAAGGLAAMEFLNPPMLLAAPVQLAAEMLTVTAVELKLVAELHELLERPAQGTASERGSAYLMSWVRRRAITPQLGGAGTGRGVRCRGQARAAQPGAAQARPQHHQPGAVPGRRGRRRRGQPASHQGAG